MKRVYRKTFFWTAVFLFLVAAPLLILSASGFRYDFQEKSLIQTGTLVLKTQPEGARVWINQEEQGERTPAEIEQLLPQRYSVRVEADDFHPWQKEVDVREAEITLKDNILLIPKKIPLSPVASKGIRTFALAPDGRHIAYSRREEGSDESVWLLHLDENQEEPLLILEQEQAEPLSASSIDGLLWSSDSRHLAVGLSSRGKSIKRYFLMEAKSGASSFEIVLPGLENSNEWRWSDDGTSFFFIHQDLLYRADPAKRTIEQAVSEKIDGYTTIGGALYFVSGDAAAIFKKDLTSQEERRLASIGSGGPERNKKRRARFILPSQGDKIALVDRSGRLSLLDLEADPEEGSVIEPIASRVDDASFSGDGEGLLYQTGRSLFVYPLKKSGEDENGTAHSAEMLVQQKEPAFGSVWYGDQTHVLYGSGETIFIAEAGEKASIYPLIRTPGEVPRFVYNDKKETLYLVYREQLYQADLSFEKATFALLPSPAKPAPKSKGGLFERIQEGAKEERVPPPPSLKGRS